MTGSPLFPEFGKKARDILAGYSNADLMISISSRTKSGLRLTSSANSRSAGNKFHTASQVSAHFEHDSVGIHTAFDSNTRIYSFVSISNILPSAKAIVTMRLPDYSSRKLEVRYELENATLSSTLAMKERPHLELSAGIDFRGVACCSTEASFDVGHRSFTECNAGICVNKPDYIATVTLEKKGDKLRTSLLRYLDRSRKGTLVAEYVRTFSKKESVVSMGGRWMPSKSTFFSARLDSKGSV